MFVPDNLFLRLTAILGLDVSAGEAELYARSPVAFLLGRKPSQLGGNQ